MNNRLILKTRLELAYYQNVEKLFDDLSQYYDFLYPDIRSNNELLCKELSNKILKPENVQNVLDCCCGTGHTAIQLAKLGFRVTGLDISSKMIERATSNAAEIGVDVNFGQSNILDLVANIKEKFDIVICRGNSFSHIKPDDFEAALENMRAVLKKGGICYVDTRNFEEVSRKKPLFEHRAYSHLNSKDVISFYVFDYKKNLRAYNIFFVFFDRKTNNVSHKLITISGYFVFENALVTAFKKAGFKDIKRIKIDNEPKGINTYIGIKK